MLSVWPNRSRLSLAYLAEPRYDRRTTLVELYPVWNLIAWLGFCKNWLTHIPCRYRRSRRIRNGKWNLADDRRRWRRRGIRNGKNIRRFRWVASERVLPSATYVSAAATSVLPASAAVHQSRTCLCATDNDNLKTEEIQKKEDKEGEGLRAGVCTGTWKEKKWVNKYHTDAMIRVTLWTRGAAIAVLM